MQISFWSHLSPSRISSKQLRTLDQPLAERISRETLNGPKNSAVKAPDRILRIGRCSTDHGHRNLNLSTSVDQQHKILASWLCPGRTKAEYLMSLLIVSIFSSPLSVSMSMFASFRIPVFFWWLSPKSLVFRSVSQLLLAMARRWLSKYFMCLQGYPRECLRHRKACE